MVTIAQLENLLGKGKVSGSQVRFRKCPLCGREKRVNPCFSLNLENSSFYCFYLGKGGYLKEKIENLKVEDFHINLKESTIDIYKEFKKKGIYKESIDLKWDKLLKIKEKCYTFQKLGEENIEYLNNRGISYNSTLEVVREVDGKMAIPLTNGDYPVAIKYRTRDKIFSAEKGSDFSYFINWQNIKYFERIYIVEGEIDLLTMIELGYANVVSLPGGASNLKCIYNQRNFLLTFSEIVLMLDSDQCGEKARDIILNLLKTVIKDFDLPMKVYSVDYKGEKDINDVLTKKGREAAKSVVENPIVFD